MRNMIVMLAAAGALAGCGGGTAPQGNNTAAAQNDTLENGTDYQAEVIALHPRLQEGVMLRALRDAKLDCQSVTSMKRIEDIPDKARWQVVCDERSPYVIEIARNGDARIRSRR